MKRIAWASLLLLLGAFAALRPIPAAAVTIGFDPPSPFAVTSGDAVSVDIVVSDLGGGIVSAFDLDVSYDTSFLTATSVTFGFDLGIPFFFEALTSFDLSTPGLVDLAEVSLLSDAQLVTIQGPSVILATLGFSALQTGTTALAFLFGPGQDVKGANNQVILPVAVPEPATWLVFVSGLAALMLTRRRTRRASA
ncbi:MAG: cohesin domain-containing protein [Kiloniellaceae bacterium]